MYKHALSNLPWTSWHVMTNLYFNNDDDDDNNNNHFFVMMNLYFPQI